MEAARALYAELRHRGIDARVLRAMAAVPRELFAPGVDPSQAYVNEPLPLPDGQTISQPLVVGRMVELLELSARDRVLDVGCGSGWHAAVIAQLAGEVWAIERHPTLVALARGNLARAQVTNVHVLLGDGTQANLGAFGLRNQKPLDNIRVQQMIPRLFELAGAADAEQVGAGPAWDARYRLDALRPADGAGINLAHLLLGHGGDLGWVEWMVLDERAPAAAPRPYERRYFKRGPAPASSVLDRAVKDLFDAARLFPAPGQRP